MTTTFDAFEDATMVVRRGFHARVLGRAQGAP